MVALFYVLFFGLGFDFRQNPRILAVIAIYAERENHCSEIKITFTFYLSTIVKSTLSLSLLRAVFTRFSDLLRAVFTFLIPCYVVLRAVFHLNFRSATGYFHFATGCFHLHMCEK